MKSDTLTWVIKRIGYAKEQARERAIERQVEYTNKTTTAYAAFDGFDLDNYLEQVAVNYAELTNGFDYYETFIEKIRSSSAFKIVPMYELPIDTSDERPRIALRHDIDADPITGLRLARHLAKVGICGSFYLLHSASYYGNVFDGVFVRNPKLTEWVSGYIVAGAELGLHNDALGMYCEYGFNPLEVLHKEMTWLRAQGAVIRGTTAHNSIVANGAENYEIFVNKRLWKRKLFRSEDASIALGLIALAELGLSYEGTFAEPLDVQNKDAVKSFVENIEAANIRNADWMETYLLNNPLCRWTVDYQVWLVSKDRWIIAGSYNDEKTMIPSADLEEVIRFLSGLPKGSSTVIVLHPAYFGDYGSAFA